jgi:LacI family transcriptional regulator
MPPTTTMKRIAGELGVSITTVSKVLNNRDDIGHATRARVLAKVAELGYQPNAVARSLTLRRTHTIGVVIPDLMHSFFVEIVAGLEAAASARGYGLLLCSSNEDPAKERQELDMLRQRQVDGIVLGSANASAPTITRWGAWPRRTSSIRGAAPSPTSPARRSSTPSAAPRAIAPR